VTSQRSDYPPHGRDKAMAPWSKEQNTFLDQWNYVPPPRNDFDELFDPEGEYEDFYDDGPTSCRDMINDCDMHLYYSD
jgi:exonuclease 3'-5' domain-containing protein 1